MHFFYYFQNTICNDKLYWNEPIQEFLGPEADISLFWKQVWGEHIIITLLGKLKMGTVQPSEQLGLWGWCLNNHLLNIAPWD